MSPRISYTMGCPPVRGDNPRALTNMVLLFYTAYISVDFTYHEILRAKVGKGGIIAVILHMATAQPSYNLKY